MSLLVIESRKTNQPWKPEPCWTFDDDRDGYQAALLQLVDCMKRDADSFYHVTGRDEEPTEFRVSSYDIQGVFVQLPEAK